MSASAQSSLPSPSFRVRHPRLAVLLASLYLMLPAQAQAQVQVTIAPVTLDVGQEVSVPIQLSGVAAGQAVSSFQFIVKLGDPNLVFVGHQATATLTSAFTVNSNPENGRIGGFTSSLNAFSTAGTLVVIKLKALARVATTVSLTDFKLNSGNPAHTPSVPVFNVSTNKVAVNTPPQAADVSATAEFNTSIVIPLSGTDPDQDPLLYEVVTPASHGLVELVSTGTVTYTPDGGYEGTDSFTYRAFDGVDYSAPATVFITVSGQNPMPLGRDDSMPSEFGVRSIYPNPAKDHLSIEIALPAAQKMDVAFFDLLGRSVLTQSYAQVEAGLSTVSVGLGRLPRGVYYYQMKSGGLSRSGAIMVAD